MSSSTVLLLIASLWSSAVDAQLLDLNLTYPDFTLEIPIINRKVLSEFAARDVFLMSCAHCNISCWFSY